MSEDPLITVAISTMGQNLHKIFLPAPNPQVGYLVVVQNSSNEDVLKRWEERDDILVVFSNEKGLSRSRNKALTGCATPYMYICDDDVVVDVEKIVDMAKLMKKNDWKAAHALITHEEGSIRWSGPKGSVLEIKELGMVASCEVFLHCPSVAKTGLVFNPDFGVGSGKYPIGEENLFLYFLVQEGIKIHHVPWVVAHHPGPTSSSRNLGLRGAEGKIRVANTIRPRKFSFLRRWRAAIQDKNLCLKDKIILSLTSTPAVKKTMRSDIL